ncbi:hypothetical protein [Mesorhizobium sp.]|uniref:hypothetical protein n=1 Tax=Mesorhizobium sp. TaxID=1871066 RepID=UPI0007ED77D6|nr:hypothetical protein [Mesorhizobium sp.]RWB34835.1 MAG: hypothetical protein EOQ41_07945 [Mesorhizobium sp.]RWD48285.1 MAG: hypothetical protein EOS35_01695 [Mesorhizobium sp.]TIT16476.1 MAG: hypothetical protein E5W85_02950 [Mesorhizobium sp.]TKD48313.1 MAG: hypothetical protein E5W98_01825 [Mesorhizobium sp.]
MGALGISHCPAYGRARECRQVAAHFGAAAGVATWVAPIGNPSICGGSGMAAVLLALMQEIALTIEARSMDYLLRSRQKT